MGGKPRPGGKGMTAAQVRRLALSLPEASEQPHFVRTSFRVGTKIFATMTADGTEAMVVVKPPERLDALLSNCPDAFFSYGGWTTRNGALGVRLAAVEPALMRDMIIESWSRIASKRARAALDGAAR